MNVIMPGLDLGEGKKKKKSFSVMLACKENNSMYKEISRVTYEQDFLLGFLPVKEELRSLVIQPRSS